jgi:hypothetical protein
MRRRFLADSLDVDLFDELVCRISGAAMHDFFVGLVFVAIVMIPCVVALMTRLDDGSSKYDR